MQAASRFFNPLRVSRARLARQLVVVVDVYHDVRAACEQGITGG